MMIALLITFSLASHFQSANADCPTLISAATVSQKRPLLTLLVETHNIGLAR
jgi:hypothetical protein